jgi:hypothetical protein
MARRLYARNLTPRPPLRWRRGGEEIERQLRRGIIALATALAAGLFVVSCSATNDPAGMKAEASSAQDFMPGDSEADSAQDFDAACADPTGLPQCPSTCVATACAPASLPNGEACTGTACVMGIDPCPGADLLAPSRVDFYACSCEDGHYHCGLCELGAGICALPSDGGSADAGTETETDAPDAGAD